MIEWIKIIGFVLSVVVLVHLVKIVTSLGVIALAILVLQRITG